MRYNHSSFSPNLNLIGK